MFFLLLRTTDDDSTTQRKVTLLLERVNKVKWKTAENVEEEADEKVCDGMRCLITVQYDVSQTLSENEDNCVVVSFYPFTQDYAAEVKLLQEKQAAQEKEVSDLKHKLETEIKVKWSRILLIHL